MILVCRRVKSERLRVYELLLLFCDYSSTTHHTSELGQEQLFLLVNQFPSHHNEFLRHSASSDNCHSCCSKAIPSFLNKRWNALSKPRVVRWEHIQATARSSVIKTLAIHRSSETSSPCTRKSHVGPNTVPRSLRMQTFVDFRHRD